MQKNAEQFVQNNKILTSSLKRAGIQFKKKKQESFDYAAALAHEIRTPLSAVRIMVQMLIRETLGPLNSDQKQTVGDVMSGIDRVLRMINGMLELAQIDSGMFDLKKEVVLVDEVLKEVNQLLQPQAEEKQIDIHIPSTGALVKADRDKLIQILTNLVNNSIKYTPKGGRIFLSGKSEGKHFVFSVKDTGYGLSEKEKKEIFKQFVRAKRAKEQGIRGAGLGLTIAQRLIELHGGNIRVESREGEGCEFLFTVDQKKVN